MHIGDIEVTNFLSHDHSRLKLPKTGIVLISGQNGAGKSSFVEGVSFALSGETLRKDKPWRGDAGKGQACAARIHAEKVEITRERKGRKTSLAWHRDGEEATEFETPTKAQEALEEELLPFDVWRRSHVFSSSDATHFSLAGDADRKKLLETFLGYDHLDAALKDCRKDLRDADGRLTEKTHAKAVVETKLDAARARVKDAEDTLASLPEGGEEFTEKRPESTIDPNTHQELKRKVAAKEAAIRALASAGGEHIAEARHAEAVLEKLKGEECPTCSQEISKSLRKRLQTMATDAREKADAEKAGAKKKQTKLTAELEKLESELRDLRKQANLEDADERSWEDRKRNAKRATQTRTLAETSLAEAKAVVTKALPALVNLEEEIDALTVEAEELRAAEGVLGLKGVRAHLLGKVLVGVEHVANAHLSRLSPNASLGLSPYSDSGEEKISLKVDGLGKGNGRGTYKSASQGERRRVDVALLLGVAEMSAGARGIDVGTIFFDEVFDALDETGIDGVLDIIRDLAETRCVVVITHRPELVQRLKPAAEKHVHVDAGVARVVK